MAIVPTLFVRLTETLEMIEKAAELLRRDPGVVKVLYSLGEDSTGDPSLYFRVVLTNAASREDRLAEVTERIAAKLIEDLRPEEQLGLTPYFSFRSKSENDSRRDPEWN